MKDISQADLQNNLKLVARKSEDEPIKQVDIGYGIKIGGSKVVVIAGPCALETKEDRTVSEIAKHVKEAGAHALRAGVYKPVTFPHILSDKTKYPNLNEEGYKILAEAGKKHSMPVVSEVGSHTDVAMVAKYIDVLQVGTRNMHNVQLLEAVAKTNKPVILKRHFGASLRDWLGAAEHIAYHRGSSDGIILCERGVVAPHTHNVNARFLPDIAAIVYAKMYSHLPVLFDPSHSTFERKIVAAMARAAVAAGADGLLIDVHPVPSEALIDPLQALDYSSFDKLVKEIKGTANVIGRDV